MVYNTLNNRLEDLELGREVKIYLCGPTVYDFIHIGNARPLIFFDVVRRYLEESHTVTFIQNFTDIDDKIIDRAKIENKSIRDVSERFIEEYYRDADALNVKRATIAPKATEYVDSMVELISTLLKEDRAYVKEDGVYFNLSGIEYGDLSNRDSRVDFVLWKYESDDSISWPAPFGRGRPGWHTECVSMISSLVGEVDIHCGGQDLIFPHHENEIVQHRAMTGKMLAKYWMHNSFIKAEDKKMSKSEGNTLLVRDLLKDFKGEVLRFFILSTHYRKPILFSIDSLKDAEVAFSKISRFIKSNYLSSEDVESESIGRELEILDRSFSYSMESDFNIQGFFGDIFKVITSLNSRAFSVRELKFVKGKISKYMKILGFDIDEYEDVEIERLVEKRRLARLNRDYSLSDRIRDQLKSLNVEVKDGIRTSWQKLS